MVDLSKSWHGQVPESEESRETSWVLDTSPMYPKIKSKLGGPELQLNPNSDLELHLGLQYALKGKGLRHLSELFQPIQWKFFMHGAQERAKYRSILGIQTDTDDSTPDEPIILKAHPRQTRLAGGLPRKLQDTSELPPKSNRFYFETTIGEKTSSVFSNQILTPHPEGDGYLSSIEFAQSFSGDEGRNILCIATAGFFQAHFDFNTQTSEPSYPIRMIYASRDGFCLLNRESEKDPLRVFAAVEGITYHGEFAADMAILPGALRTNRRAGSLVTPTEAEKAKLQNQIHSEMFDFLDSLYAELPNILALPYRYGLHKAFGDAIPASQRRSLSFPQLMLGNGF